MLNVVCVNVAHWFARHPIHRWVRPQCKVVFSDCIFCRQCRRWCNGPMVPGSPAGTSRTVELTRAAAKAEAPSRTGTESMAGAFTCICRRRTVFLNHPGDPTQTTRVSFQIFAIPRKRDFALVNAPDSLDGSPPRADAGRSSAAATSAPTVLGRGTPPRIASGCKGERAAHA